jgi:predicted nucleic acid-binding protein
MGLMMQDVGSVYLDTNVFIAAFEADDAAAEKAAQLISMTRYLRRKSLVTSEMTLAELLVLPFRRGDVSLIASYSGLLSSDNTIDVRPADREIFIKSAGLRCNNPSLKLPDAVHLATAILAGCTHMLTADKGIKPLIWGIPFTILRPDKPTLTALIESLSA